MKKYFILFFVTYSLLNAHAQEQKNEIKGNLLFFPVLMLNAGYERAFNEHWSGQADVFISPWKSFANNHLQTYMGHLEARYYFKETFKKWYIGANIGLGVYDIQKWNYWNTNKFQRGFNIMVGAVVGYQMNIDKKWNLDFFIRGGLSQGFYHGYYFDPNTQSYIRYDGAKKWNKSGEWTPYGGGIMLSYLF